MRKLLTMSVVGIIMLLIMQFPVCAANLDEIKSNMIFETNAPADLHEEASEESDIVTALEAGTVVFTTENAENNWCRISAGEHTGYIQIGYLKTLGDQDLINQEFEQSMNDNHRIYDEVQQAEEQRNKSEIWEILIPILIIAVCVAAINLLKGKNKE
ncbi:MAG: SH3 domain-containing protein [Butyrivibrio sp.]|nr:SH3 domain-containing protein [Butyrivibrio sp.]